MLELVRRALIYGKSETAAVLLLVENGLTSTPTSAVRGVHLAPLAPLILAAHACYCIRCARVTTAPTNAKPRSVIYLQRKYTIWDR